MLLVSLSSPQSLSLPVFVIPSNFIENLIKSTIALFVIIDPVGNVPLFIAFTEKIHIKCVCELISSTIYFLSVWQFVLTK